MKKVFLPLLVCFSFFTTHAQSIYDFKIAGLEGNTIDMAQFKGKKILIVNTASKCGHTPQYDKLQKLYTVQKDRGLVIIGFPANNFLSQEPGSNAEIAAFCSKNYGVTFPMAAKISVRGKKEHPLYAYLRTQAGKKRLKYPVTWNFGKYLIDEKGELIATFAPNVEPDDQAILNRLRVTETNRLLPR